MANPAIISNADVEEINTDVDYVENSKCALSSD